MMSLYNLSRIINSQNDSDSIKEDRQRRDSQNRLISRSSTLGKQVAGKKQLDAILNAQQHSDAAERNEASLDRPRTLAMDPFAKSIDSDDVAAEAQRYGVETPEDFVDEWDASENIFKYSKNSSQGQPAETERCYADKGITDDYKESRQSEFSEFATVKDEADSSDRSIHPSTELANALSIDISSFDVGKLISYLDKLRTRFIERSVALMQDGLGDPELEEQPATQKDLLTSLYLMQGYADAQFRRHADLHQLDHAFEILASQILAAEDPMQRSTSQLLIGSKVSEEMQATRTSRQNRLDHATEDMATAAEEEVQAASQRYRVTIAAESASFIKSGKRKKDNENKEATLPLIVQRSV